MSSHSLTGWMRERRLALISAFDVLAWGCAASLAAASRVDFDVARVHWAHVAIFWCLVSMVSLTIGRLVGLHRGRAPLASLQEMWALGLVAAGTGTLAFLGNLMFHPPWLPRSVPLVTMFLALVLMGWGRATWQRASERGRIARARSGSRIPVLVLGAGDRGSTAHLVDAHRGEQRMATGRIAR